MSGMNTASVVSSVASHRLKLRPFKCRKSCYINKRVLLEVSGKSTGNFFSWICRHPEIDALTILPPPPLDNVQAVMVVWRIRGKIIRAVRCCMV